MAPFMKLICMFLIHKLVLLVSQVNLCNADWDANVSSTKDHGPALSAGVNALFYPSLGGTHARTHALTQRNTHARILSNPRLDSVCLLPLKTHVELPSLSPFLSAPRPSLCPQQFISTAVDIAQ